jgi:hypothetical protein
MTRRLAVALLLWSLYLALYCVYRERVIELTRQEFVKGVGLGTDLSSHWSLFDAPRYVMVVAVTVLFVYFLCTLTSLFFRRFLLSVTGPIVLFFLPPSERREYLKAVIEVAYYSAIWGALVLPALIMAGTYLESYAPWWGWKVPIAPTTSATPLLVLVVGVIYHLSRHTFSRVTFPGRGLCRGCGYSLCGNVSGVCPECGVKMKTGKRK